MKILEKLLKYRILTIFTHKNDNFEDKYVLKKDINIIISYFKKYTINDFEIFLKRYIISNKILQEDDYSLLKNIFLIIQSNNNDFEKKEKLHHQRFIDRKNKINSTRKTQFARSAYYMGSKANLRSFILESLSSIKQSDYLYIDLMAGSGAMAGIFSDFGRTIASDAMQFPGYLSIVQGGGYSKNQAIDMIKKIKEHYILHYSELNIIYQDIMKEEDNFLKLDDTHKMALDYYNFLTNCSKYSNNLEKIIERKTYPKKYPYILFSEYFANIYFGINQSVQIDSLRYAIDNIDNQLDRSWALGALIATCSKIASSHAAHFAQPIVLLDKNGDLKYNNIKKILMKRRMSVWREFEAVLLSLAEESINVNNKISYVDGPWHNTIKTIETKLENERVIIYVDAPYTREEYRRYYHVLETLVKYNYPTICGKGKLLIKNTGERFSSEFFTKENRKIENIFEKMFIEILKKGWICAWSYSNNGIALMTKVINTISENINCSISAYSTPYFHKSQNKTIKTKKVEEYLILFEPTLNIETKSN